MPVHNDNDSKRRPTSTPNRSNRAKLWINTIPAKKTGRQNAAMAVSALSQNDAKRKLSAILKRDRSSEFASDPGKRDGTTLSSRRIHETPN